MDNLTGARAVLGQAQQAVERASGALRATADGDLNAAKELVRAVFAAGFKIPGLSEIIGRIEQAGNEMHSLAADLAAIHKAIDDVK